ncbi:alpha/beta-hydrolase [Hyaloscypha variabilis]|jgi:3-oxoadipate enol-lactonase|uniref:Alpha/beta-hydrolase n=1 Tax=Hyaloscypha variabilis (strain UAMH 11265 / GT02V1 / F) TaxID=1149755 RepID=A0A2J6RXY1_HYAVF|nr:alpha/beta-hydrolase [Hyaloscypha variabilis F]
MQRSGIYQVDSTTNLHVVSASNPDSTKPTLVFLHFWGGSSGTYEATISHLSPNFHCVAVDFRGWGLSTGPQLAGSYSIHLLATDIETLILKLGIQDFILVGHSMGGKVAQLVAGRNLVNGLKGVVLIAPAPPTPFELPGDMKEQQLTAYSSVESAGFVARNVLSASKLPDETISSLVEDMLKGNKFAAAAWPSYAMGEDIVDQAIKIKMPVLVIGGGKDIVEPVERLRKEVLGRIQGAKLIVVEESGHLLPVEAPALVARLIRNFAASVVE